MFMEETVPQDINAMPLNVSVANVADVPETFVQAPSPPKLTTVEVNLSTSDHGKQEAQDKWIKLMQMTPTRLIF